MGAYSTLCAFDVERLRSAVAPSVRGILEGLGVRLELECELLDDCLAVRATSPVQMISVWSSRDGACRSTTCRVTDRCPMHASQRGPVSSEAFGERVMDAVFGCCVADPASVVIGRRGDLFAFQYWYARRVGRSAAEPAYVDDEDEELAFAGCGDPLVELLIKLAKRGAAWGWGDGGFGEGLLGWLEVEESARLAALLDAYDLSPEAPQDDPYLEANRSNLERELRSMSELRTMARACAARGLGVLLRRD